MPLTPKDFHAILGNIKYKPGYDLILAPDKIFGDRYYLQVEASRPDTFTGEIGLGHGGKYYLSPHMTEGELVRKAFTAFAAYEEHECREAFQYQNRRVFGPHIAMDALMEIADRTETRG